MPIQVEAPDGTIIEFPDNTPDATINKVMSREYGGGVAGLGRAALEGLKRGGASLYNMGHDLAARGEDALYGAFGVQPEQVEAVRQGRAALGVGTPRKTEEVQQRLDEVVPRYEPKNTGEEYAQTLGEFAAGIPVGPGSLPMRAISAVTAGMGSEAAGQWTKGTPWETPARIAGGVAGGLAADAGKRLLTPFPINPQRARSVANLREEGIPLSAGQITGRKSIGYMENELGGSAASELGERQLQELTRATTANAGIPMRNIEPEAMRQAYDAVDNTFSSLANRTAIPLDSQLQDDLLNAVTRYEQTTGTPAPGPQALMNRIAQLSGQNGGVLDGVTYRRIVTELREMGESTPEMRGVVGDMRRALDEGIERNLGGTLREAWRTARRHYGNLKIIEEAATGAGASTAEGLITPGKLRSAVDNSMTDRAYLSGRGDMTNLARSSSNVMTPLADSGTAGRTRAQNLGMGIGSLAGGLVGYSTGGPGQAVGGAAAGIAAGAFAPWMMGQALMSRPVQAYLANQLSPGRGPGMLARLGQSIAGNAPHIREQLAKALGEQNGP